jgi:serine/threonine protein kinase
MPEGELGGRLIDGRFELRNRLGSGGMAMVWRAMDTALRREVALKEVRAPDPSGFGEEPVWLRERVLREAQALARLHHPNVVTIHHIVDTPDLPHPWLVMELVSGGSLDDRLRLGPLSLPEAIRIGRGVLAALRSSHAAGILHRDVKPGNVLLRPDGTPVLTDFGIAAMQEAPGLTATGMLIGSPEYMAPERIQGQEGLPASDLWSLGMLLYVAVEGHNPMRRETTVATIAAVLGAPIPPSVRSGPLAPVLSALLNRDPAQRANAETVDRMLGECERALTGSPLPPTLHQPRDTRSFADPLPGRDRTRGRLHPLLAVAMVLAVVTVVGVVLWATNYTKDTPGSLSPTGTNQPVASNQPVTSNQSGSGAGTTTQQQDVAEPDLLTPQGIRAMIKELDKKTNGAKIVRLTAYPSYASIEAVKAGDSTLYDEYSFRDGAVTFEGPGGTLDEDENTIDLNTVNWDALPGLLKQADAELNVANPTIHYIILDSELISQEPELLVYVADDYGGGYLQADLTGKVTRKVPR